MDARLFEQDVHETPASLTALADALDRGNPWQGLVQPSPTRIVLLGMGSSHFANDVLARRLQARGIHAVAQLASGGPLPAVDLDDVVILVSASGGSAETHAAATAYDGRCLTIAVTNTEGSAIQQACTAHVALEAGPEKGGVACRSFAHTLGIHLALEDVLLGTDTASTTIRRAAQAAEDLLGRSATWLPELSSLLIGPDITAFVAPDRRLSSALQSALMLREGPRRAAVGCETGDWSHIDVYLTKTMDYRMLLMVGSPWEATLLDWCRQRGSTVVALGGDVPGAAACLRYRHDDEDDVRLLVEPMVAELIAAQAWQERAA